MYPGTIITWTDQSDILTPEINTVVTRPLFAAVITSDKGKEEWLRLSGQEWFDMYAPNNLVDFKRHGQPLLQTAMAVNAGAEILCKRVVADDACLANIAIIANVNTTEAQKTNADGAPLYTDADGNETTVADGNTPIMISTTTTRFSYKSAANCKSQAEVIEAINTAMTTEAPTDGSTNYPLFIVFDNGRGDSKKRIRITPNYQLSKNNDTYFTYDIQVIESGGYFPAIHFCLNPDMISNGSNISMQYKINTDSSQIAAYQYDKNINDFIDVMVAASGLTAEEAASMDLLFGTNKKAKPLGSIVVDTEGGVDLQIPTGQLLLNGDNGSFGDIPISAESYGPSLAKALAGYMVDERTKEVTILTVKDGAYDPVIYNTDRYKIDAIFDANYPDIVKRAAEQVATYREDCMFFRDMGIKNNNLELIANADYFNLKNKFCTTYCTYYDVIDPYSKKQITVTIMYHLIQLVVNQFNNGRNLPLAGIKYGFVLNDVVENSIGFTPTICPNLNEKEELADLRINYATYIDNTLVIESLFTSQERYTQFSFSNNVLAVQEVVKEIRRRCPAIRYSIIDGEDLEKYKAQVEEIIAPYKPNFKTLELTYLQDDYYTENKIFYAALAVRFRDFVQTEYFNIIALSSSSAQ